MVSEELKAIVEEIKKQGKLRLVDGASKEQIEAFEKNMHLNSQNNIESGYLFRMEENSFRKFNYMVLLINRLLI